MPTVVDYFYHFDGQKYSSENKDMKDCSTGTMFAVLFVAMAGILSVANLHQYNRDYACMV